MHALNPHGHSIETLELYPSVKSVDPSPGIFFSSGDNIFSPKFSPLASFSW